jgi:hypothetical protein
MNKNSAFATMFASIGDREDVLEDGCSDTSVTTNFFRNLNKDILNFSTEKGNEVLLSKTHTHSTLFRGGLFGKEREVDVLYELQNGGYPDILIVGSNPNAGEHTQVGMQRGYRSLRQHIDLGFLGEREWVSEIETRPGWSPFNTSTRGWTILSSLLEGLSRPRGKVAFANFTPWGSSTWKKFPNTINDDFLVNRILKFSDDLNAQIIEKLRPKLVIVPFSLIRCSQINQLHEIEFLKDYKTAKQICIKTSGRLFNINVGSIQRGATKSTALFMPHPSSFRLNSRDIDLINDKLRFVIMEILERPI